jgi:hypothetical protein
MTEEATMERVLHRIDERTREFADHPLFSYMRDRTIDPMQRLSFVPALSHFVMTFADLYRFVLRDDGVDDELQAIVNAHAAEDGGHWKWFLADLQSLGEDRPIEFTDALRFLWGEETVHLRMLSYRMCRLGLGASSLQKLVLVSCIEATGRVMLGNVGPLGAEVGRLAGKKLVYFGEHHFATESGHTLEQDEVHARIARIQLTDSRSQDLTRMVDEAFAAFMFTADEIHRFTRGGRRLAVDAAQPRA